MAKRQTPSCWVRENFMVSPSTESWQQHDILLRNRFYRITCPLPGAEATHDDTGVKTILAEDVRHTGAGGLAQSGAIEVNLLLP